MAFVLHHEIPDRYAVFSHRIHNLVGFAARHDGVILPLDDEERPGDGASVVHGGNAFEECAHLRVAFVAILEAPQVLAIGGGALKEGDEVRRPESVDSAADAIGIPHRGDEHYIATVAGASDHHAAR